MNIGKRRATFVNRETRASLVKLRPGGLKFRGSSRLRHATPRETDVTARRALALFGGRLARAADGLFGDIFAGLFELGLFLGRRPTLGAGRQLVEPLF